MNNIVTMILGKGKGGVARCRLKEAGAKSTSRRTEMSYKAKQAGEFALQNETQDPVRMVNDAVVWCQGPPIFTPWGHEKPTPSVH